MARARPHDLPRVRQVRAVRPHLRARADPEGPARRRAAHVRVGRGHPRPGGRLAHRAGRSWPRWGRAARCAARCSTTRSPSRAQIADQADRVGPMLRTSIRNESGLDLDARLAPRPLAAGAHARGRSAPTTTAPTRRRGCSTPRGESGPRPLGAGVLRPLGARGRARPDRLRAARRRRRRDGGRVRGLRPPRPGEPRVPRADAVDLREPPFVRDRSTWTQRDDYSGMPALRCRRARRRHRRHPLPVGARPQHGGCCAVLTWNAFARPSPLEQQTWMLSVSRDRVVWQRTHALRVDEHEFIADAWLSERPSDDPPGARRRGS